MRRTLADWDIQPNCKCVKFCSIFVVAIGQSSQPPVRTLWLIIIKQFRFVPKQKSKKIQTLICGVTFCCCCCCSYYCVRSKRVKNQPHYHIFIYISQISRVFVWVPVWVCCKNNNSSFHFESKINAIKNISTENIYRIDRSCEKVKKTRPRLHTYTAAYKFVVWNQFQEEKFAIAYQLGKYAAAATAVAADAIWTIIVPILIWLSFSASFFIFGTPLKVCISARVSEIETEVESA